MACPWHIYFRVTRLPLMIKNKENNSWICRLLEHDMSKPVPQDQRHRYGCRKMKVLATNQPIEFLVMILMLVTQYSILVDSEAVFGTLNHS